MWYLPFEETSLHIGSVPSLSTERCAYVDSNLHRAVVMNHRFELAVIGSRGLLMGDGSGVGENRTIEHVTLGELARRRVIVRPFRLVEWVSLGGVEAGYSCPAIEYPCITVGTPITGRRDALLTLATEHLLLAELPQLVGLLIRVRATPSESVLRPCERLDFWPVTLHPLRARPHPLREPVSRTPQRKA